MMYCWYMSPEKLIEYAKGLLFYIGNVFTMKGHFITFGGLVRKVHIFGCKYKF